MCGLRPATKEMEKLIERFDETSWSNLRETCDRSCTTGYDNGGSTGLELFESGFMLAGLAGEKDVFVLEHEGSALFFIGPEVKVLTLLEKEVPPTGT